MHHGRVGHGFGTRLLVGLLRCHLFPVCSRHFATAEKMVKTLDINQLPEKQTMSHIKEDSSEDSSK